MTGAVDEAEAKRYVVKNAKDKGPGSLRKMIAKANRTPGWDRIVFRSSISGAIDVRRDLEVTAKLRIDGRRGRQTLAGPDAKGAALSFDDAGRAVVEQLDLERVSLLSGSTDLNLRESTVTGDGVAGEFSAGVRVVGYGAGSDGSKVVDSEIDGFGYGVVFDYTHGGTVLRSTVTNSTHRAGVVGPGRNPSVEVIASTITGNAGGGVVAGYYSGAVVKRSTITGNDGPGVVTGYGAVSDSTITGNKGGGVYGLEGAPVENTIIAGNSSEGPGGQDCAGSEPLTSRGGNVFGDATACGATARDRTDVDPGLGPLSDNGGPTQTQALTEDSPAIGLATASAAKRDQRGIPRRTDPDSGAFELVLCGDAPVTVVGSSRSERLVGTDGDDTIHGFGGRDVILGLAGNDVLCGGPGNDLIRGGSGNDDLIGARGRADRCRGGEGRDTARSCEDERGVEG